MNGAPGDAAVDANDEGGAYDANLEWLHCNKCNSYDHDLPLSHGQHSNISRRPVRPMYITQCGHVFCLPCLAETSRGSFRGDTIPNHLCPLCGSEGAVVRISTDMPPEVERIVAPAVNLLEEGVRVYKFQYANAIKLIQMLKKKSESQAGLLTQIKPTLEETKALSQDHIREMSVPNMGPSRISIPPSRGSNGSTEAIYGGGSPTTQSSTSDPRSSLDGTRRPASVQGVAGGYGVSHGNEQDAHRRDGKHKKSTPSISKPHQVVICEPHRSPANDSSRIFGGMMDVDPRVQPSPRMMAASSSSSSGAASPRRSQSFPSADLGAQQQQQEQGKVEAWNKCETDVNEWRRSSGHESRSWDAETGDWWEVFRP
ncbi:hypothetical protein BC829DRAFT_487343 [Chytridium lagenaria]|nr:hypothetical protein BC829DRAFT_487343 [Chytridium lagenaria]